MPYTVLGVWSSSKSWLKCFMSPIVVSHPGILWQKKKKKKVTNASPPIHRCHLYPPSSFKLVLAMLLAVTNGTFAHVMQKEIWKALEGWALISCCSWKLETIIGSKPKLGREKTLMSFLQGEKTKHPSWQPALNLVLNAEPGRQTQAEVPSLIPLSILRLLPLYPHPFYSAYTESTLFPVPQRKRRSWEGADTFLTLGHP